MSPALAIPLCSKGPSMLVEEGTQGSGRICVKGLSPLGSLLAGKLV